MPCSPHPSPSFATGDGDLYIADHRNSRIRKVDAVDGHNHHRRRHRRAGLPWRRRPRHPCRDSPPPRRRARRRTAASTSPTARTTAYARSTPTAPSRPWPGRAGRNSPATAAPHTRQTSPCPTASPSTAMATCTSSTPATAASARIDASTGIITTIRRKRLIRLLRRRRPSHRRPSRRGQETGVGAIRESPLPPSASSIMCSAMPNALYYGDNLPVLRDYLASESVDLIYLDPPFNSNASYNVLCSKSSRASGPRPR